MKQKNYDFNIVHGIVLWGLKGSWYRQRLDEKKTSTISRKEKDMWLQRNPTHLIINVTTSLRTSLRNRCEVVF